MNGKKKVLAGFLALNSMMSYSANKISKDEKKYVEINHKSVNNKSKNSNYKLLERTLNQKNKELKDLYMQGNFVVKPEYLEWQIFYNLFYNYKDRGKADNEYNVGPAYSSKSKSINLGMSIPVRNVEDLNIDMEISPVSIPDIAFNPGNVRAVQINELDLNYTSEALLDIDPPPYYLDTKTTGIMGLDFSVVTNKVQYSPSGIYVFENLDVNTTGNTKGIFLFGDTSAEVSGNVDYGNAAYGVSGNISLPYTQALNASSTTIAINNISLDGDYKIQGDWELTRTADGKRNAVFIGYSPALLTKDGTVTFDGNLKLDSKNTTLTSGAINGLILSLDSRSMSPGLKAELINNGTITAPGRRSVGMTLMAPRVGQGILNLINNGTINMEYVYEPVNYSSNLGTGINIFLSKSEDTGQALVKTGNINLTGKELTGVSIARFQDNYSSTAVNSLLTIDGSGGLINVAGRENIGLYIKMYNGQISSNNGFENMKNMNILVDGMRNTGVYINVTHESEKDKNLIADSSSFQSIAFGENARASSLFSVSIGGKLIIDKSMESVFGTIDKGVQSYVVVTPGSGIAGVNAAVVNYSDIKISEEAKAMTAFYVGTNNTLENYGNIVNNSSVYGFNNAGGVGLYIVGTALNRGNIEMNNDGAMAIYNIGQVPFDSQSDFIKINGNRSVGIFTDKSGTGGLSNVALNKLDVTGNESMAFHMTSGSFILSPYTEDSLEVTVDGQDSAVFSSSLSRRTLGKYTINGKLNAHVKNGGIAIAHSAGIGYNAVYLNPVDLFDTSNGDLNIKVDENSYAMAFLRTKINLSDLLKLDSHGIKITGSQRTKLNWGTLTIDADSDLDKNTSAGNKMYRDTEISFSDITVKDGVTVSGTEDSQFGMAQNGNLLYYGYEVHPTLINEGRIILTGKDSVGIYNKDGIIENTGSIEATGDKGIGIYGKVSELINKGSIKIGDQGIGIYGDTYLNPDEYDYPLNTYIENTGSITAESGAGAVGIYAAENSEFIGFSGVNTIMLKAGSDIDVSASEDGIGIYADKSSVTGTGKISVGKDGFGIYAKDTNVNLNDFELNLLGDNAVGIFTDGTASFTGNGVINVDGKGIFHQERLIRILM